MRVASAWSVHPDPRVAAREAHARLVQRLGSAPQLMVVHASCLYDGEALCGELRSLAKQSPSATAAPMPAVASNEAAVVRP